MTDAPEQSERFMALALAEARKGSTSPNPHVGAVIALGDEIVGIGHHERAGQPHAEVNALATAGTRARGATLYCTLEPCNHHGRTPPCCDAILAAGITKVVIASRDPARHGPVSGVERLRAAGVEVITGVREAEGDELVADFAMLMREGRPLTVLKGASTLDGKIASRTGDSKWITGEPARAEGHALRAECGAVMVGVGTVLADDPRLDVRMVTGRDPIRIVLDTQLRTPPTAKVIAHESSAPTWVVHGPLDEVAMVARAAQLRREGVELVEAPVAAGTLDLPAVLRLLGQRGVMRLLVEGGARVHGALIETGLADRGVFFVAPLVLGDRQARSLVERASPPDTIAAASRLRVTGVRTVGVDVRIDARFERG